MKLKFNNIHFLHTRHNLFILGINTIQAIIAAATAVIIVHSFSFFMKNLQKFSKSSISFLPFWTVLGAIFVSIIIYKISPRSRGEGVPSYIRSINHMDGSFNIKNTIFKYLAALIALGTFSNGGLVGPVGRVSAGLSSYINKKLKINKIVKLKVGAVCGFAAAISLIFHAPVAGGIFAVEILEQKNMKYSYLFPAMLSSAFAVFLAKILNLPSFYNFSVPDIAIPNNLYLQIILVGVFTGFAGRYYNIFYKSVSSFINRNEKKNLFKEIMFGSILVSLISFFINPDLMGTSNQMIQYITSDIEKLYGNMPISINLVLLLFILSVAKAMGNCITVGTGLSAGFAGPIIIVGMILGAITARITGIEFYSSEYFAMICAGFTGMLASSMNIPIAAMILSLEMFGYNYAIVAIISTIIAFKINDYATSSNQIYYRFK